jgi:hypothetical protein
LVTYDKDKKQIDCFSYEQSEDVFFFGCSERKYKKEDDIYHEDEKGSLRQVLGSGIYVTQDKCIENDGTYLVEWDKQDGLRSIGIYPIFIRVPNDNTVFVKCSNEQYVKNKTEYNLDPDEKGKKLFRRICGTRLYIESKKCKHKEGFYLLSTADKAFTIKLFQSDRFECFTESREDAVYREEKGRYLSVDKYYFRKDTDDASRYIRADSSTGNYRRIDKTQVFVDDIDCLEVNDQAFYKIDDSVEFKDSGSVNYNKKDESGNYVNSNKKCFSIEVNGKTLMVDLSTLNASFEEDLGGPFVGLTSSNPPMVVGNQIKNTKNIISTYTSFRPNNKTSAVADLDFESDLKALRIWLFYNRHRILKDNKDPEFRTRQKEIYKYWFQEAWGEIPPVDSDWEEVHSIKKSDGSVIKQQFSFVKERYAYTSQPDKRIPKGNNLFLWETLKKCLIIKSDEITNK